ncbi:MAG: Phosphotransferase [Paramarteilia canceri]
MAAVSHHCDGVDGPHARRLKLSSPIGEMLDHGVDSWSLGIIFLTLNQISDFKKQFTGVMYLPWSYDVAMLALFVYYLILGLFPDLVHFLHEPEIFFYIEWILIAIVSSQILSSLFQGLMRMYKSYKQTYNHYSRISNGIISISHLMPLHIPLLVPMDNPSNLA